MGLEQNVTKQTYLKISCRSQKCLVQSQNQQFYLVNWILFSNMSNSNIGFENSKTEISSKSINWTLKITPQDSLESNEE